MTLATLAGCCSSLVALQFDPVFSIVYTASNDSSVRAWCVSSGSSMLPVDTSSVRIRHGATGEGGGDDGLGYADNSLSAVGCAVMVHTNPRTSTIGVKAIDIQYVPLCWCSLLASVTCGVSRWRVVLQLWRRTDRCRV